MFENGRISLALSKALTDLIHQQLRKINFSLLFFLSCLIRSCSVHIFIPVRENKVLVSYLQIKLFFMFDFRLYCSPNLIYAESDLTTALLLFQLNSY